MGSNKPMTFAELVDCLDPEERARLERRESFVRSTMQIRETFVNLC